MSGRRLRESEYIIQQVILYFGELDFQLVKAGVNGTNREGLFLWELENIDCLVFRYLNTGELPF